RRDLRGRDASPLASLRLRAEPGENPPCDHPGFCLELAHQDRRELLRRLRDGRMAVGLADKIGPFGGKRPHRGRGVEISIYRQRERRRLPNERVAVALQGVVSERLPEELDGLHHASPPGTSPASR